MATQRTLYSPLTLLTAALFGVVQSLGAWPWVDGVGTVGVDGRVRYMSLGTKFSSGSDRFAAGAARGEQVHYFEDRPGSALSILATDMTVTVVPLVRTEISLAGTWVVDASSGAASRSGFGDSRVALKGQMVERVPLAVFAGLIIPTGAKTTDAGLVSLGDGFWVPFVGLAPGTRIGHRFLLFSSQQINFPARRALSSSRYASFADDHERRGLAWQGGITFLGGTSWWGGGLSAEWMVSAPTTGKLVGERVRRPGRSHVSARLTLDQKLGPVKTVQELLLPIAGVNSPASPSVSAGVQWKFRTASERRNS